MQILHFELRRWVWWLAAAIFCIVVIGGVTTQRTKTIWMDNEFEKELQDTLIAFNFSQKTQDRRMYVIDGLGHEKYVFPIPTDNKVYGSTPSISSKGDIAYTLIDFEKQIAEIYIYNYNTQENIMIKKKTFDSKMQHYKYGTTYIDDRIGYFNWSPDGTKLAFFDGKDFVIHDLETSTDIARIPTTQSARLLDRMTWISNNTIALLSRGTGSSKKVDLGLIDKSTFEKNQDAVFLITLNEKTTQLKIMDQKLVCEGFIQPIFHAGIFYYDGKEIKEDIPCIDTPELQSMFGSKEWPITWMYQSSNTSGRFYFYRRYNEIFEGIAKTWIEGYDKVTGDTFFVYKLNGYLDEL